VRWKLAERGMCVIPIHTPLSMEIGKCVANFRPGESVTQIDFPLDKRKG
jgi:hypothetical protein